MVSFSEVNGALEKGLAGGNQVLQALRTGEIQPITTRDELRLYTEGHYRLYMLKRLAELQEAIALTQRVIIDMPEMDLPRIAKGKPVWRAN